MRRNITRASDQRAVARAQARRRAGSSDDQPAVANQRDARDQAVGEIEIVRREHARSRRPRRAARSRSATTPTARSSRPVNGSSSSTSRGWCSSARSSASRCRMPRENPRHVVVGAVGQAGATRAPRRRGRRRRGRTAARRTPGSAAPTARDTDAARARAGRCARAAPAPSAPAVARRRSGPRRCVGATSVASMPISVDLPAPFGPSRPTMSPRARREARRCETRAAPAEMSRDVDQRDRVEVDAVTQRGPSGRRRAGVPAGRGPIVAVERAVDCSSAATISSRRAA